MSPSAVPRLQLGQDTSWTAIWQLTWPLVLTMIANAALGVLDAWVAGHAGAVPQAVVGLVSQIVLMINALTTAVAIGTQALVARFVGAASLEEAGQAAQQSLLLAMLFSLVMLPLTWVAAPWIFQAMGTSAAVQEAGVAYLRVQLLGLLPMDLVIVLGAIFRAQGRTTDLLKFNLVESATWAACSLGLGLGAGWGLSGIATGFVAGKTASMTMALLLLRGTPVGEAVVGTWTMDRAWFGRILRIGAPAGVQVLVRNLGMLTYFSILGLVPRPTQALAAFSIGFRIESLAFLPVFALNIATATLVGQNLGAGRPDEAQRAAWRVVRVGVAVMSAFGLLFWFAADSLAAAFTADPTVRAFAADYLRVMAFSEPFLAIVMVLNGALQGAGDSRAPMTAVIVFQIAARLPLAYGLAIGLGWGPTGAWWAMTSTLMMQAAGTVAYFNMGIWRTRVI